MLIRCRIFLLLFFLFHFNIFADLECSDVFNGSRLGYAIKMEQKHSKDADTVHPKFANIQEERQFVSLWNEVPDMPNRISYLLPKHVHLINHQLPRPANVTTVKLGEPGSSVLMARASYSYADRIFSTNVAFSTRALTSNLFSMKEPDSKNWLVGEDATAAILYLHGGGTRSTGGHTAEGLISHYKPLGVDVVALDLPWHAEGHREVLPNFKSEIRVLSAFVKKYIPPNVPVFVWGHSWGALWGETLMRMTDGSHGEFSFHPNLKAVLLMSPPVDAAPGQSMKRKLEEYQRRIEDSRKNKSHLYAPNELLIWTQFVEQGKISPISGVVTINSIAELDQTLPKHRGENFIPALMVVGKRDPLVYVGFEDLFSVYRELRNVEAYYLDDVGHLLRDYSYPGTKNKEPVDIRLASNFIAKHIGVEKLTKQKERSHFSFISITQEYANNLAFREFVNEHSYFLTRRTQSYKDVQDAKVQITQDIHLILKNYYSPVVRVRHALEQLVSIKSEQEYKEVMKEFQEVILQPDFLEKLGYKKLIEYLRRIDTAIIYHDFENVPADSSNRLLQRLTAELLFKHAREILEDVQIVNFFRQHSSSSKVPPLIRKIINAPNLETAVTLVKAEHLPSAVEIAVLGDLLKMFEIMDILEGVYMPTMESINRRSTFNYKDMSKIEMRIDGIRTNVEQIKILKSEIAENTIRFGKLVNENNQLIKDVQHNIRIIKEAFSKSMRETPESLKEDIDINKKELDALVEASDQLNEAIETIFTNRRLENDNSMDVGVFNEIVNQHESKINAFTEQYDKFASNRRQLRRKLVVAIEKGEMGEEFKEAVLAIYGTGSGGYEPKAESGSAFLELDRNIRNMAELEAVLYNQKARLHELNLYYQELFTSLLQLIQLRDEKDVLAQIPHVHIYYSDRVRRVLESDGVLNFELSEPNQRLEFFNYVRNNESHFQQVHKEWKDSLKSEPPPLLPTADAAEF